ncbi:MAG: flagellar hook-basal body complex protein FliE [Ruminococcus sp.]|jgi:flagellar hook-basal body complex protein FliE|nr:flagellar hook-basal body complex protein FliE [Ruminococcus sp.]
MPISSFSPITTGIVNLPSIFAEQNENPTENAVSAFSDIFANIYGETVETNLTLQTDAIKLINGEIDDLHTIYNDMTKASIAVETFVAVKNAAVSSFQSIIAMQV